MVARSMPLHTASRSMLRYSRLSTDAARAVYPARMEFRTADFRTAERISDPSQKKQSFRAKRTLSVYPAMTVELPLIRRSCSMSQRFRHKPPP